MGLDRGAPLPPATALVLVTMGFFASSRLPIALGPVLGAIPTYDLGPEAPLGFELGFYAMPALAPTLETTGLLFVLLGSPTLAPLTGSPSVALPLIPTLGLDPAPIILGFVALV